MPQTVTGTGVVGPAQGLAAIHATIEARLQALEQAVFGGGYVQQQINLGTVGNVSTTPGPASGTNAGQSSGGNR